jgi:RecA/RadA recombinase
MSEFFRDLVKDLKDDSTTIASDGLGSAEFGGFIDTGSYALNAVLSGSLYGGVADNKTTGFAGESSTGKTFFVLGIVKTFLETNPTGGVVYYDTESAVTKDMMKTRGIDIDRVIISEPNTIQEFRTKALKTIDTYLLRPKDKRPPMMFVLDSLGQMSSSKELADSTEGNDTRDMTKSQIIKATFRVITSKLAKAKIPLIITNHVYAVIGAYVPTSELSGGSGFKYAASTIAMLSKKKDKDGTDIIGNFITVKMYKSRLSKENAKVTVKLSYKTGLDRYYGLLDIAEEGGIFVKSGTRYELPNGEKVFGKSINDNPLKYYTPEIMLRLEKVAQSMYSYGDDEEDNVEEIMEALDTE